MNDIFASVAAHLPYAFNPFSLPAYSPAFVFFAGALLVLLSPATLSRIFLCSVPIASALMILSGGYGFSAPLNVLGLSLHLFRLDELSLFFIVVFHIGALLFTVYALKATRLEQCAGLVYAGAAIGAVAAADLISLFLFFECAALGSLFLIWAGREEGTYLAGLRYFFIHLVAGLCLLLSIVLMTANKSDMSFNALSLKSLSGFLIFLSLAIKCGFPLLHNWIQDSYPKSSPAGTLALAIFTTKMAIYALMRGYAGLDALIFIGVIMALFALFLAAMEDDLRKALSYGITSGLGFMIAAIGVGTDLALNAACAFALSLVLAEALIFMSLGSVLHRTGTAQASHLGGLFHSMPLAAFYCMIGCASLAGAPLFIGFAAKGLLFESISASGHMALWLLLMFAVSAELVALVIRIPFLTFFGSGNYERAHHTLVDDAPLSMCAAMGISALLCVSIGIAPILMQTILPFPAGALIYTASHVFTQMQVIAFGALAFVFLYRRAVVPEPLPFSIVEFDWTYRRLIPFLTNRLARLVHDVETIIERSAKALWAYLFAFIFRHHGPNSTLAQSLSAGTTVMWIVLLLVLILTGAYLL